jgi:hypothetical protein
VLVCAPLPPASRKSKAWSGWREARSAAITEEQSDPRAQLSPLGSSRATRAVAPSSQPTAVAPAAAGRHRGSLRVQGPPTVRSHRSRLDTRLEPAIAPSDRPFGLRSERAFSAAIGGGEPAIRDRSPRAKPFRFPRSGAQRPHPPLIRPICHQQGPPQAQPGSQRASRQAPGGTPAPFLRSALFSAITGCVLTAMHTGSA